MYYANSNSRHPISLAMAACIMAFSSASDAFAISAHRKSHEQRKEALRAERANERELTISTKKLTDEQAATNQLLRSLLQQINQTLLLTQQQLKQMREDHKVMQRELKAIKCGNGMINRRNER